MLIFYMSDVVESNSEAAVTSRTWAKSWRRFHTGRM